MDHTNEIAEDAACMAMTILKEKGVRIDPKIYSLVFEIVVAAVEAAMIQERARILTPKEN